MFSDMFGRFTGLASVMD